jgi:hypothetical protein
VLLRAVGAAGSSVDSSHAVDAITLLMGVV